MEEGGSGKRIRFAKVKTESTMEAFLETFRVLNFQQPSVSLKLIYSCSINKVKTAHALSIAECSFVLITTVFTLG